MMAFPSFPSPIPTFTDNPLTCPLIYSCIYAYMCCVCRTSSRMESIPREGGGEGTVFGYNYYLFAYLLDEKKEHVQLSKYVCMFLRMIVGYIYIYLVSKSSRGDCDPSV